MLAIFTGIVLVITSIIVLLPFITSQKEVLIPDVTNMLPTDAVTILQDEGFIIADTQKEISSDEIEAGKVVKTDPVAGTKRTKGTSVTLYVSTGNSGFVMEDFTGKNYLTVQGTLEAYGILVLIERETVEDTDVDANQIIRQSVAAGEKVSSGDTVILYIPDVVIKYPDFTDGTYTKADVEDFCNQYNITCKFVEDSTGSGHKDGDIIKQSKPKGYTVTAGTTITITIYKEEDETLECNPLEGECE